MATPLPDASIYSLFTIARTYSHWLPRPVEDDVLKKVYDLARLAPTSANSSPAHFVFVKTAAAKERLKPALMPANVEKTLSAPVCVIVAGDTKFYENLPKLYPSNPKFKEMFTAPGSEEMTKTHILRNGTLQGAYLIMAARAVGLDCGPMSGFDNGKVDAEFFPGGRYKSNFLINLGYGDPSKLHPRNPRLEFGEACEII